MCVAYFWLKAHSQLLLLIAFNRDEFLERPTNSLHLWDDESGIIGGRDAVNGGTWLGLTRSGRFAFVTNFREVRLICGHPTHWCCQRMSPADKIIRMCRKNLRRAAMFCRQHLCSHKCTLPAGPL